MYALKGQQTAALGIMPYGPASSQASGLAPLKQITRTETTVTQKQKVIIHNMIPEQKDNKYQIKVLQKVFRVFDLFNEKVTELSASQITSMLNYNQSTVFRILANLENDGYLDKNPETGKYRLGVRLFILGNLVMPFHHLKTHAKPLLRELNRESGETVHLAVLHQNQVLYVDKLESNRTLRVVVSRVGFKLPAHCSGVGKVLLAYMPREDARAAVEETGLPAFTDNTITTWNQLKEALQKVRNQGFATDEEEIELGLKCVAAPVFVDGKVTAAVSLSVPKERFDQNVKSLTRMVMHTAHDLGKTLTESLSHIKPSADRSTL